jgi:hypothetical protein
MPSHKDFLEAKYQDKFDPDLAPFRARLIMGTTAPGHHPAHGETECLVTGADPLRWR